MPDCVHIGSLRSVSAGLPINPQMPFRFIASWSHPGLLRQILDGHGVFWFEQTGVTLRQ